MCKTLIISLFLMGSISIGYHWKQNTKNNIGGKISVAKSFWLGYAVFHYFIYTIIFYLYIHQPELKLILLILILCFYFRMFAQGLMMFVFKNWSPRYGIGHNVLSVVLIGLCLIYLGLNYLVYDFTEMTIVSLFLINLMFILIVDNIYAQNFYIIIGEQTKGDQAIWYASDDKKFNQINQTTKRNNYFFGLFSLGLIIILLHYDKF